MRIKIPSLPPRAHAAYERYLDWVNVPIWTRGDGSDNGGPRIEIRRIDIGIAAGFVFCVGYYWWTSGWQGAVIGGAMYVLLSMVALWML